MSLVWITGERHGRLVALFCRETPQTQKLSPRPVPGYWSSQTNSHDSIRLHLAGPVNWEPTQPIVEHAPAAHFRRLAFLLSWNHHQLPSNLDSFRAECRFLLDHLHQRLADVAWLLLLRGLQANLHAPILIWLAWLVFADRRWPLTLPTGWKKRLEAVIDLILQCPNTCPSTPKPHLVDADLRGCLVHRPHRVGAGDDNWAQLAMTEPNMENQLEQLHLNTDHSPSWLRLAGRFHQLRQRLAQEQLPSAVVLWQLWLAVQLAAHTDQCCPLRPREPLVWGWTVPWPQLLMEYIQWQIIHPNESHSWPRELSEPSEPDEFDASADFDPELRLICSQPDTNSDTQLLITPPSFRVWSASPLVLQTLLRLRHRLVLSSLAREQTTRQANTVKRLATQLPTWNNNLARALYYWLWALHTKHNCTRWTELWTNTEVKRLQHDWQDWGQWQARPPTDVDLPQREVDQPPIDQKTLVDPPRLDTKTMEQEPWVVQWLQNWLSSCFWTAVAQPSQHQHAEHRWQLQIQWTSGLIACSAFRRRVLIDWATFRERCQVQGVDIPQQQWHHLAWNANWPPCSWQRGWGQHWSGEWERFVLGAIAEHWVQLSKKRNLVVASQADGTLGPPHNIRVRVKVKVGSHMRFRGARDWPDLKLEWHPWVASHPVGHALPIPAADAIQALRLRVQFEQVAQSLGQLLLSGGPGEACLWPMFVPLLPAAPPETGNKHDHTTATQLLSHAWAHTSTAGRRELAAMLAWNQWLQMEMVQASDEADRFWRWHQLAGRWSKQPDVHWWQRCGIIRWSGHYWQLTYPWNWAHRQTLASPNSTQEPNWLPSDHAPWLEAFQTMLRRSVRSSVDMQVHWQLWQQWSHKTPPPWNQTHDQALIVQPGLAFWALVDLTPEQVAKWSPARRTVWQQYCAVGCQPRYDPPTHLRVHPGAPWRERWLRGHTQRLLIVSNNIENWLETLRRHQRTWAWCRDPRAHRWVSVSTVGASPQQVDGKDPPAVDVLIVNQTNLQLEWRRLDSARHWPFSPVCDGPWSWQPLAQTHIDRKRKVKLREPRDWAQHGPFQPLTSWIKRTWSAVLLETPCHTHFHRFRVPVTLVQSTLEPTVPYILPWTTPVRAFHPLQGPHQQERRALLNLGVNLVHAEQGDVDVPQWLASYDGWSSLWRVLFARAVDWQLVQVEALAPVLYYLALYLESTPHLQRPPAEVRWLLELRDFLVGQMTETASPVTQTFPEPELTDTELLLLLSHTLRPREDKTEVAPILDAMCDQKVPLPAPETCSLWIRRMQQSWCDLQAADHQSTSALRLERHPRSRLEREWHLDRWPWTWTPLGQVLWDGPEAAQAFWSWMPERSTPLEQLETLALWFQVTPLDAKAHTGQWHQAWREWHDMGWLWQFDHFRVFTPSAQWYQAVTDHKLLPQLLERGALQVDPQLWSHWFEQQTLKVKRQLAKAWASKEWALPQHFQPAIVASPHFARRIWEFQEQAQVTSLRQVWRWRRVNRVILQVHAPSAFQVWTRAFALGWVPNHGAPARLYGHHLPEPWGSQLREWIQPLHPKKATIQIGEHQRSVWQIAGDDDEIRALVHRIWNCNWYFFLVVQSTKPQDWELPADQVCRWDYSISADAQQLPHALHGQVQFI